MKPFPTCLAPLLFGALLLLGAPTPPAHAADLQSAILKVQRDAQTALVNIQPVTETFNRGEKRKRSSVGSGFLVDYDGNIVTNYHVAGRAKRVMVTLFNKERVEAELVGEDPSTDLAVIRIPKELVTEYGMKPLSFGDSESLEVGEFVMALGSPLALARTMTFGVVSNKDRYLPEGMSLPTGERTGDFNTWIQTDAAINPGNSGGPLINLTGQVIGVNARGAMFADNIGFAIPAATATAVSRDLIDAGEVKRSWAGISFQSLQDWEALFGMDTKTGVLVASVEPGGPAQMAGLQAGDIVLTYGGETITARFDEELPGIYQLIASTPIGAKVPLTVLRRDGEIDVTLEPIETGKLSGDEFEASEWGFTVRGITDQMVFSLELESGEGVLVEGVRTGGPAARGRLRRGQVVVSIADEPITDLAGFEARYEELAAKGEDILLHVLEAERQRYVLVRRAETAPEGTR
ncbi:MAG: trypsin-like peptidase domain-containing protein [Deltaproteobacteria bacterium]|nr:trypsin-like peptidase domain-containing protein [Deltaproteobacteria bacterium]